MYTLSGSGTQSLTAGTTKLYVANTIVDPNSTYGDANPVNRYHVGLLRLGDGTGFYDPIPVLDGPQIILVSSDVVELSYAIRGSNVIEVTEYPPVTPGGSLMGSFTPATLFTETADIVLGMFFYADAASTLTDIGLYCPVGASGTMSGQPIEVRAYPYTSSAWSGTIPTLVNGWNHWGITPLSLTASVDYLLYFLSPTGNTRSADTGYSPPTVTAGHAHLGETSGTFVGAYELSSTMTLPTNNIPDWVGLDVVTTTP